MENPAEIPEFYVGSPVDAEDLRYREEFIKDLWEAIEAQHVLLTAPRRTGKTSVMDHLRAHPPETYAVIYENVQDLSHPADFFSSLLSRFYDEHPDFFRDTLGKTWDLVETALGKIKEVGLSEFKVALRESDLDWRKNWKQHGATFFEKVRHEAAPILLIIDELPDMLLNMRADDADLLQEFLAWFRTQRQDPKPKHDTIRWLVGGSVNLSGTLDSMGMVDLINDFDDIPLPVLTNDDVTDFVTSMLIERGVELDEEVPSKVIELLGRPIPLFMQIVTQELFRSWKKNKEKITAKDVDSTFSELVKSTAARDKLQHYYTRLERYYQEPKLSAAHELLSKLSLSEAGFSRSRLLQEFERILDAEGSKLPAHARKQQFNQLLRDLENDFYVAEISEDHFDFASGILKAWWKKYYA
ncbi:MAG: hypothetical protein AAGA58_16550 [Verrucomicrobiota bacterium]